MKQCTRCKKKKKISEFYKDNSKKDKKTCNCKNCFKKEYKHWYYLKGGKKYRQEYQRQAGKEVRKKWLKKKQKDKKWKNRNRILGRECMRRWQKKQTKNPKYRLDNNVCWGINKCLKGTKAYRTWESLVGYTLQDLVLHLEKQFDDKMNWDNYGNYWHIDHRKPKSWFKYETAEDEEFKKCWALENLQPLEASKNRSKNNRFAS